MIPLKVDQVLGNDGDPESVNRTTNYFIRLVTKEGKLVEFGEKQVVNVLACTALLDAFSSKYNGDVDMTSDAFIGDLALKLPGKFLKCLISHEKDFKDPNKMRVKIETVEPAGKGGGATKPVSTSASEEWD